MTAMTFMGKASRTADQVRAEARELDPAKVLLTVLFALPFALGWLVGAIVRICGRIVMAAAGALWTVFAWAWTAVVVGFRTARSKRT